MRVVVYQWEAGECYAAVEGCPQIRGRNGRNEIEALGYLIKEHPALFLVAGIVEGSQPDLSRAIPKGKSFAA